MARFSERIGAVQNTKSLQVKTMDADLRNSLWNALLTFYDNPQNEYWRTVARCVAQDFRKVPADDLPFRNSECREWVKRYFYSLAWYQVYDLIEFIAHNHDGAFDFHRLRSEYCVEHFNQILEREMSGYRFISGVLVEISDETEAGAISTAVESTASRGLFGASEHLRNALTQLGKKPNPDYRNSIKESISAVESVAKQISGSNAKGLDGALDKLSQAADIHGALKSAFKSLYGYTSDEGGIRHAMLDEPNVGFAEAKYMLVSCSAFVHYLVQKADDAKLL